jgi:hypothetical protein
MLINYKKFQYKKIAGVLVFSMLISPIVPFSSDLSYKIAEAASTLPPYSSVLDSSLKNENTSISASPQISDFAKYGTKVLGCNNSAGVFKRALSDLNEENPDLANSGYGAISGSSNSYSRDLGRSTNSSSDYILNQYGNKDADISAASGIAASAASAGGQAVSDAGVQKSLKQLNENEKKMLEDAADKKVWEQCLNGIAVKIAQKQIATMTQGILNWVNTGFEGDPLFVRDQASFFKKIENDSLQSLIAPLIDPSNSSAYPYGKDLAKSLINNSKATFQNVARSTLNDSLPEGTTQEDYSNDFAKGGWGAWFSLTQRPANNPLGFSMITSQEIANQKAQAEQEKRDELNQGRGFLSAKKCVEEKPEEENAEQGTVTRVDLPPPVGKIGFDPSSVEMSEKGFSLSIHYDAPSAGKLTATLMTNTNVPVGTSKLLSTFTSSLLSDTARISYDGLEMNSTYRLYVAFTNTATSASSNVAIFTVAISPKNATGKVNDPLGDSNCLRWETTTPGSVIADQTSTVLSSPIRQLELARTVNDSLDQVFNALVNQLTTKGLESLDSYTSAVINSSGSASVTTPTLNTISKQYYDTYSNLIKVNTGYGGWYSQAQEFDITRDLGDIYTPAYNQTTGAIIRDAKGKPKLVIAKKGIISVQSDYIDAATASVKALDPILPAIGKLDYCIPGPNPSWETRTKSRIYDLQNYLSNIDFNGVQGVAVPRWLKTDANLGIASAFVGTVGVALAPYTYGITAVVAAVFSVIVSSIQGKHARANAATAARQEIENANAIAYFNSNQAYLINSLTDRFGLYQEAIAQKYTPIFGGITGGSTAVCNDGADNDGDGLVDAADPICHSDGHPNNPDSWNKEKTTESGAPATCGDGISNGSFSGNLVINPSITFTKNGISDEENPSCYPYLSVTPVLAGQPPYIVAVPNGTNGLTANFGSPRYISATHRRLDPVADGYDRYFTSGWPGSPWQCSDGIDNADRDGNVRDPITGFHNSDGLVDKNDPACHTDGDPQNLSTYNKYLNSEVNTDNGTNVRLSNGIGTCSDGADNDGDGFKDANDSGCHRDYDPRNMSSYIPYKTTEIHINADTLLPMAAAGMNITKDIENYDANIAQARKDYQTQVTQTKNNLVKLKSIKTQVDSIVAAAQARRKAKILQMKADASPVSVNFCPGVDPDEAVKVEEQIYVDTGGTGVSGYVQ